MSTFAAVVFESLTSTDPKPGVFELPGDTSEFFVGPKEAAPLFSPVVYRAGKGRGNDHVEAVTAIVLDFDRATEAQFRGVLAGLEARGIDHAWYHTHSHGSNEKPFAARLIVPFAQPVHTPSDRAWKAVWAAAVADLGASGLVDKARSDRAGAYYLPSKPSDASPHQTVYVPGELYSPPAPSDERPIPAPAPAAPPTVAELRETLARCPSKQARRAGKGLAPSPPPGKRAPDDPPRRQAWFAVTGALSRVAPAGTPIEMLEEVLRPAWYAEQVESPDDFTPWEVIQENLTRNYTRASAEKEAEGRARQKLLARMAAAERAAPVPGAEPACPADELPRICIDSGVPERLVVDSVIAALADAPNIFSRGGEIVAVESAIRPLNRYGLIHEINRCCVMVRTPRAGEEPRSVLCPERVAAIVASIGAWPSFREVLEVRRCSYLSRSGRAVTEPGYDAESRCVLAPTVGHAPVPDAPTREQASAGLRALEGLVSDFPFETPAHLSGWLALVLTLVARPALRQVPMFMVDAASSGSGKTLLVDLAAVIATGAPATKSAWSTQADEQRKAVLSVLRAGATLCLLDNQQNGGSLGSHVLDNLLTSEEYSDRVLGQSTTLTLPARTVWAATGNNLSIDGDMQRRLVPVRLASPEDDPSARTGFRLPRILETAFDTRGELLHGALVALRGYCAAGRPALPADWRPWGHPFEGWSDLIRGTLAWLGASDPVEARRTVQTSVDSSAAVLEEVLSLLGGTDEWRMTKDLMTGQLGRALQACLADRAGEELSVKSVGRRLVALRQRVVGGRRLVSKTDKHAGALRWRVENVDRGTP